MKYTDLTNGRSLQEDFSDLNNKKLLGRNKIKANSIKKRSILSRLLGKVTYGGILAGLGLAVGGPAGALAGGAVGTMFAGGKWKKLSKVLDLDSKKYRAFADKSGVEEKLENFHSNFIQGINDIKSNQHFVDSLISAFDTAQQNQDKALPDRDISINTMGGTQAGRETKVFLDSAGQMINDIASEVGINTGDLVSIYCKKYGNSPLNIFFEQVMGDSRIWD